MMDCVTGGMGNLWGLIGFMQMMGLAIVVALGVIWLARRSSGASPTTETPLDLLKRRLAQGEVTPEEFSAMKRQLQES